jgi:hypothetical protein
MHAAEDVEAVADREVEEEGEDGDWRAEDLVRNGGDAR